MKQLDRQQVTIMCLTAAVIVGFGLFRYAPIVRRKLALNEQMARQSLSMEQIQDYSRRLPELQRQKRELVAALQENEGRIPEGKQFARLWQQVTEVMNDCSLQDQRVQPADEKQYDQLACVPLQIECRGTLQQIFTFFQRLEKFDRLICFDRVSLENDAELSAVLKVNAKANVFYRSEASGSSR